MFLQDFHDLFPLFFKNLPYIYFKLGCLNTLLVFVTYTLVDKTVTRYRFVNKYLNDFPPQPRGICQRENYVRHALLNFLTVPVDFH